MTTTSPVRLATQNDSFFTTGAGLMPDCQSWAVTGTAPASTAARHISTAARPEKPKKS
ncbi:hypothetical protein Dpo_8c00080 [Desulfotignum phosphitoxidans DSM 13687]|uniref:Uncharacterized protein n=1 Tax=Desulfotignum phosphitoxidans DSM 13687 TaxID=1286635 RepID=S0G3G4_9BACT|nr:hypothetical protein Dpo_8c00080 [Desulfotignum phosphitoxidans DSM 13687]